MVDFVKKSVDFEMYKSMFYTLFKEGVNFENNPFRSGFKYFLAFEVDFIYHRSFFKGLTSFLQKEKCTSVVFYTIEPSAEEYYYYHFSKYSVFEIMSSATYEELDSIMTMDPGNSSVDSLDTNSNEVAWFSRSNKWAMLCSRDWELGIAGFVDKKTLDIFLSSFGDSSDMFSTIQRQVEIYDEMLGFRLARSSRSPSNRRPSAARGVFSAIAICGTNPTTPNPTEAAFAANPDGNDIFKLNLYYDSTGITFGSPSPVAQRNGNISQLIWQTRGRERQGYTLHYDYLDRLTTSYYADITSGGTASTNNKFQENVAYADARGNILSINRNGNYKTTGSATCFTVGTIDNLAFTYNTGTNRLQKVADATSIAAAKSQGFNPGTASGTATYGYDANGNMNSDPYKNMTLTYNHLNLPIAMNFGSAGSISILYDHIGKKLRKTVTPGTGTGYTQDYVDGLEYRTNSGSGTLTLEAIYHPEGRITPNGSNYKYEYGIMDHLGNTRLTFADLNANGIVDVPGDILQENHYYPFGMNMSYSWMNNVALDNKYQYNGKEFNDDFGLNWMDYGARWYDVTLGKFMSIDRFTEKYLFMSPYQYCSNNPLKYIDVNGDSVAIRVDKKNIAIYDKGKVYNTDGSQYSGKGVKFKKDGTMKLTGFLKSTVKSLDKIRAGGSVGEKLVSRLESDQDMFVIRKGSENRTIGRNILFNPSSSTGGLDEKGGNARPAFIGLAHEMAHALDWDDNGSVDESPWLKFSSGEIATNAEKYATFVENQIRAENNIPLREFYGEDSGKPVGRLLIPKTRMSLHQHTVVHGVPIPYLYKK